MVYPLGEMSIALFMRILYQLPKSTVIVPFFRGEPLLHPYFSMYMEKLGGYREVQIATNADYLSSRNQTAILHACTFVSVSLHSYLLPEETRLPTFFYDALGANVETQVSILDTLLPKRKRERFIKEWRSHVNRVRIYQVHSGDGFGNMQGEEPSNESCGKPLEEMVVYWNGRVGLCNHDWNNGTLLGDLNVQDVETVWNDTPYREVRELHRVGQRRMVATCKDCSFEQGQIYGELIKHGG